MQSNAGELKFDLHQNYNHDKNNITLEIAEEPHKYSDCPIPLRGNT